MYKPKIAGIPKAENGINHANRGSTKREIEIQYRPAPKWPTPKHHPSKKAALRVCVPLINQRRPEKDRKRKGNA